MTRKFDATRRDAFLRALAQSGNQTLAAERAKVSRSWVQLHRSTDPAFDEACRAAIDAAAQAAERDAASGMAPPRAWQWLDGAELVVRATGGAPATTPGLARKRGTPQIARARLRQWTPRAETRFVEALTETCNVKAACAEVGLTPASAYSHRKKWPAFARRWDEALRIGYDQIEFALIQAAGNFLSDDGPIPVGPVRAMTAAQAIHLLHMHKYAIHRRGKRPGLYPRDPDIEEVRAEVLRRVELIGRVKAREEGGV